MILTDELWWRILIATTTHHYRSNQYYHCSAETNCHTESQAIPTLPTSQQPATSNLTINSPVRFSIVAVSGYKSVGPRGHEEKNQDSRDYSVNYTEWMQQYMAVLVLSPSTWMTIIDNCGMGCNYTANSIFFDHHWWYVYRLYIVHLGTQNSSYMKSVTATVTSIPPNSNTLHPLLVMEFPLVMKNDL